MQIKYLLRAVKFIFVKPFHTTGVVDRDYDKMVRDKLRDGDYFIMRRGSMVVMDLPALTRQSTANFSIQMTPNNTGRPKPVWVGHEPIFKAAHFSAHTMYYVYREKERIDMAWKIKNV